MHEAIASLVLILVIYCCITTHPKLRSLGEKSYYLFSLQICRGRWGKLMFSLRSVSWGGLMWGWRITSNMTHLHGFDSSWRGAQLGPKARHLGSFPCGPLCRVLELPHRMVADFQERVSQESGSRSCQFFFFLSPGVETGTALLVF